MSIKNRVLTVIGIVLTGVAFAVNTAYIYNQKPAFEATCAKIRKEQDRLKNNRHEWKKLDSGHWQIPRDWK